MADLQEISGKFLRTKTLENKKKAQIKILNTFAGIAVARKLLKVIAPALGGAADGLRHDDVIHGAPKSFTTLALTLCDQIDKAQVEDLIVVLLEDLSIDGKDVDVDEYFAANYGELIEILEFALRENFSTFFTGKGIKARFLKVVQTMMSGQIPLESDEQ